MQTPKNLHYTKEHEWIKIDGDIAILGITDFAQHMLTDVVYVEPPKIGLTLAAKQPFMVIESVKSVSDIFACLAGQITEVNNVIVGDPAIINKDPYGQGWLVKIKLETNHDVEHLMSAQEYAKFCEDAE